MNLRKWRNFMIDEEEVKPEYNPSLSLLNESIFDNLDLTSLSESEIKLLMEGRLENVLKKYANSDIEPDVWQELTDFDEQYKYKHLDWMGKIMSAGNIIDDEDEEYNRQHQEPWEVVIAAVSDFIRFKSLMKKKDINQYATLEDLLNSIQIDVYQRRIDKARKARKESPIDKAMVEQNQTAIVYEDNRYFVVRPNTVEASCYFGKKTRWCIAQTGNSYFNSYTEANGKIFYFIKDDQAKDDDANAKMAIEITQDGDHVVYNAIWDRDDDPTNIESSEPWEVSNALTDEPFYMKEETAEQIMDAIISHIQDNPAQSPFAELERRIENEGEFDGGFVTCSAHTEYDEYSYMYVSADVRIPYLIKAEGLIQMLENDEIDIDSAEEAIREALEEDGSLFEQLVEDVDIGASKWWWPNSDYHHQPIEVDIKEFTAPGAEGWTIMITLSGWADTDAGGTYYKETLDEAERFCEYMQEEWGERNTAEIEECFDNHIYKYFVEYASASADAFRNLKSDFVSGQHTTENPMVYYTVDDEDDENSDLNLWMEFSHELTPEALRAIFDGKEIVNASGNTVFVAQRNLRSAIARLKSALRSQGDTLPGFLEKAIYNIYQKAAEFSSRQLKLDFGPEWDTSSDEIKMPEVPDSINTEIKLDSETIRRFNKGDNLVPTTANLKIIFSIYIPFHKTEQELSALLNFFKFILKNYDSVSGYVHRYVGHYSTLFGKSAEDGTAVEVQILKENMYLKIMESQMFLKSLNEDLKKYSKMTKSARYSKS